MRIDENYKTNKQTKTQTNKTSKSCKNVLQKVTN